MSAHRDIGTAEWSTHGDVDDFAGHVRLANGYWHTGLKLPVTRDLLTCHAHHRIYALFKYEKLFQSLDWLANTGRDLPELSGGLLFTGSSAHYHYLIDGIGNLSDDTLASADTIFVDADLSVDQQDFLRDVLHTRTGRSFAVVPIPPGAYRVSNVLVPKNKAHPVRVRSVRHFTLHLRETTGEGRRLYVSRRKASIRQLVNEDAVLERIRTRHHVDVVEAEDMSLAEQVRLFSHAEFVIGPHGAGLVNMVFSARPKGLLEFWHSVKQPFFGNLSKSLGISYVAARGMPVTGNGQDWRKDNAPFTVDEELALKAVDALVTQSPP